MSGNCLRPGTYRLTHAGPGPFDPVRRAREIANDPMYGWPLGMPDEVRVLLLMLAGMADGSFRVGGPGEGGPGS